jgi:uncharacterized membrane protein YbhN (UPF0104 family)
VVKSVLASRWLKLGLSLLLVAALVHYTDFRALLDELRGADPVWVAVALLSLLLSHTVCVERWRQLARPLGFTQPWSYFFGAYFTGMFMNLFAPSTVAGDLGRTLFLASSGQRKSLALTSVVAERGTGFIVLVSIGAIALILQPEYHMPAAARMVAWLVVPAFLLGWYLGPRVLVRLLGRFARVRRLISEDLAPYWNDLPLILRAVGVSVVFHFLQIYAYVFVARSLGLTVPAGYFFVLVPVVNIMGMAPITFSGVGIREAGMLFFLSRVGVAHDSAVAVGLIMSALTLASGLVGGLVYVTWQSRVKARA